ncbi:MAG TPA: hypothetical protein PLF13_13460 [candidate division Zixibacteria bacterium]|nr:hypothetical protein [candidate division Zixibacteria bacterium]
MQYVKYFLVVLVMFATAPALLAVEVSDFMVNEENYPGLFDQDMVNAAYDNAGNYVVVWRDFRGDDPAVYFQIFDPDGQIRGGNIRVDAMCSNTRNLPLGVAMNDVGQIAIAWWTSSGDVLLARYDNTGTATDDIIQVSGIGQTINFGFNTAVAMNNAGHGIVFFSAVPEGGTVQYLMGQYFDFNTGTVGDNFQIGQNHSIDPDEATMAAMTEGDVIGCCWLGAVDYYPSVLYSQLQYPLTTVVPETLIDLAYNTEGVGRYEVEHPVMDINSSGRVCVVWTGTMWEEIGMNGYSYAYDSTHAWVAETSGTIINPRQPVANNTAAQSASNGDLLTTSTGFVLIRVLSATGFNIYEMDTYGSPIASPIEVYPSAPDEILPYMAAATIGDNTYAITWLSDPGTFSNDIFTLGYEIGVGELFTAQRVHDDIGATQNFPVVAFDGSGTALVAWIDYRESSNGDVYGQRYDVSGNPVGVNFKISQSDPGEGNCSQLEIVSNENGRLVAVWVKRQGLGYRSVVGRVLDGEDFVPNGNEFLVYAGETSLSYYWPDVGVAQDGSFAVVYRNRDEDEICNVFMQRFNSAIVKIGSAEQVNSSVGYEIGLGMDGLSFLLSPRIAMRSDGSCAVTWIEGQESSWPWDAYYIMGRFYDSQGIAGGSDFTVSDDMFGVVSSSNEEIPPDIAVDDNGNYAFAWTGGYNSEYYGLWARVYDASGTALSDQFRYFEYDEVNYNPSARICPGVAGEFVGVWYTVGDEDENTFAQRFSVSGRIMGEPIEVSADPTGAVQSYPTLASFNGNFLFTWEDQRAGNLNNDIYASYKTYGAFVTVCADINGDSSGPDVTDLVYLVDYMFQQGPAPIYIPVCDVDGNGSGPDIADLVYLVNYMFTGGPDLQCP